jgi:hypothetical protein
MKSPAIKRRDLRDGKVREIRQDCQRECTTFKERYSSSPVEIPTPLWTHSFLLTD